MRVLRCRKHRFRSGGSDDDGWAVPVACQGLFDDHENMEQRKEEEARGEGERNFCQHA